MQADYCITSMVRNCMHAQSCRTVSSMRAAVNAAMAVDLVVEMNTQEVRVDCIEL